MFTNGYCNSNLLFVLAIICILAAIGVAMTLMCASYKAKEQNIKDAILSAYPDAVISNDSKSFVSKSNSYTYRLNNKDIIVTDCKNNISTIREGQIVCTVKSETTTKDAAVTDTKTSTSDNVKLQILQAYSENITDIIYTEENSSGYFKMNGEYYRFNVEGNSIVIRDDADKIINIISVSE